ncbi:MAG: adenylate/guanylate cyclase domain-containing protein, partial [Pseudomonadota bacterium]
FGVHFGPVVLGNIGSDRLEFAVIGTTVNLASRLEGLSREIGARAVISDAAVQSAGVPAGLYEGGSHTVRGTSTPLAVWTMR